MTTDGSAHLLAYANALLDRGDPEQAAERLAALLADEPDNVPALLTMARAQLRLGAPDKALVAAGRGVELAPEAGYAFYILSLVLTALERHAEAVNAAGRGATLEPHNPDRHDRLAWALLGAGDKASLAAAMGAANTAVMLAPNVGRYRITYGEAALRSGDRKLARRAFADALALDPDNPTALHAVGVLDVATGNEWNLRRIARGADRLASALRADPRQQDSRLMLEIGLRRFLGRTGLLLALPAYLGFRLAHEGYVVAGRWLAVASVLLPLITAGWFVLRLSRPLRAYLKLLVLGPAQRRPLALAALAGLLLVAAATGPAGLVQWFLGGAALAGLLARLVIAGESNRKARAAGLTVAEFPNTPTLIVVFVPSLLVALACLPAAVLTGGRPGIVLVLVLTAALAGWSGTTLVRRRRH